MVHALERILLALWVGGLWTVGYLVAPVLFASLDDRALAGTLAGTLFTWMNHLGLGIGGVLLLLNRLRARPGIDWRAFGLVLMLVLILANQYGLSPMMADLRAQGLAEGSATAARFARLHGVSAFLYLLNGLIGLALVAVDVRRPSAES